MSLNFTESGYSYFVDDPTQLVMDFPIRRGTNAEKHTICLKQNKTNNPVEVYYLKLRKCEFISHWT